MGVSAYAFASQANTMVRSVTIGGQDMGTLSPLKALEEVEQSWETFSAADLQFTLNGKTLTVPLAGSSASDEEVVLDVASLDSEASVNAAFDFGHRGPWWQQARERLSGYVGRTHEFGHFAFAQKSVEDVLRRQLKDIAKPAVDASIVFHDSALEITPSADGQAVDFSSALRTAKHQVVTLDATPIPMTIQTVHPDIVSSEALQAIAEQQVPDVLSRAPITLTYTDKTWSIDQAKLKELLGFSVENGAPQVGFDHAKTLAWLETIRPEIDVAPRDAKFSVNNGRVEAFQTSVVGQALDAAATLTNLQTSLQQHTNTAAAVVKATTPLTDTVTTNDLGIKELVAEARTNFRNSPTNRKFNLSFGANKLNGLLIQPGDTFSLVQALGPIDKDHGWRPELVIKGTKITPEFGGGLCQVATTLFRTALNAGLPIVERTNHSLRISYYEPPIGLDATIYEPKPDLKFTNDYGHALLLQTRIEGTELIFSFYGTKDTRLVDIPEPKVFNKTGIPATVNIEVDDLKPGQKECQAPGHPGADAIATYTVTKADGTKVTQEFKSHYRPLPVLCRVGKAAKKT